MARAPKPPTPPPSRGESFLARVTSEYQLGDDELELLTEVVRGLDECEALAAVIARDGYTSTGVAGQLRAHPCLAELRATRLVVAKRFDGLGGAGWSRSHGRSQFVKGL